MNTSFEGIQHLLTYPFEDPDWKRKLLIGAAIVFVSVFIPLLVPILFLAGYGYRVMQQILAGDGQLHLPEWTDWGDLFSRGLWLSAAGILYSLPSIALAVGGYALLVAPPLMIEYMQAGGRRLPFFGGGSVFVLMIAAMAAFGLAMVLGLVAALLSTVAIPHMVAKDRFSAAFQISEWWPILRANPGGFALSFLVLIGLNLVANFAFQFLYLTIVLCCLLPFAYSAFSAYLMPVSGALFSSAYREALGRLSEDRTRAESGA